MHGAEPTYITHCYKLGLPCQLRYCSKLIHPDQKGFVKGRNISEANRMIQYADEENEEGIIVFLDQQKAFK